MKKIIVLLAIGVLILVFIGYAYLNIFMTSERFKSDVECLMQVNIPPNIEAIKTGIMRKANERGVIINPEEVFISIEDTNEKTVSESILNKPGTKVETKKLVVSLSYTVKSLGLPKRYNFKGTMHFTKLLMGRPSMSEPSIPQQ